VRRAVHDGKGHQRQDAIRVTGDAGGEAVGERVGRPGDGHLGEQLIVDQVRHLEGVVAVRDRFTYPHAGEA